jgi:glycosyltransferase involved in cell wall biosynthesis
VRFSLLTPTRDRPEWLPRCIASALAQTFDGWEQIVFDNGTTSVEHLIPDDPRVKYHRGPADGPADAFQKTLELAAGEIVHPFSDDDLLTPDALETVDREIGDHEWLVGNTSFEENGEHRFQLGGPVDLGRLAGQYYLGGAVYWKRTLTDRLGGFDLDFDGAADYELYWRFANNADAVYVDHTLYRYTDHPGTDSHVRAGNQMEKSARIGG